MKLNKKPIFLNIETVDLIEKDLKDLQDKALLKWKFDVENEDSTEEEYFDKRARYYAVFDLYFIVCCRNVNF